MKAHTLPKLTYLGLNHVHTLTYPALSHMPSLIYLELSYMPSLTHLVLHATLQMGVAAHLEDEPSDEVGGGVVPGEEQGGGGVAVDLERGS